MHFSDILLREKACGYLAQTGQGSGLTLWASSIILAIASASNLKQKRMWAFNFQKAKNVITSIQLSCVNVPPGSYLLKRLTNGLYVPLLHHLVYDFMCEFSIADFLFMQGWNLRALKCHIDVSKTVEVSSYIWAYCNKDRAPLNTSLTVPRMRAEFSRLTVYMPWHSGKWKQMGPGQGEGLYF